MSVAQKAVIVIAALLAVAMVLVPPKAVMSGSGRLLRVSYSFITEKPTTVEYTRLWTQLAVLAGLTLCVVAILKPKAH